MYRISNICSGQDVRIYGDADQRQPTDNLELDNIMAMSECRTHNNPKTYLLTAEIRQIGETNGIASGVLLYSITLQYYRMLLQYGKVFQRHTRVETVQ